MLATIGLCLILASSGQVPQENRAEEPALALKMKLSARVENYTLKTGSLEDAFIKIASEFKLPMGIEWVRTDPGSTEVNLSWRDVTVAEILHSVLDHYPEYRMDTKNGIMHISPSQLLPDRQDFLKLKVGQFEVQNLDTWGTNQRLAALIKATVTPPKKDASGTSPSGGTHSHAFDVREPKLTIKLQDATVEAVLDAIALASWKSIWVVTFREEGQLTPTGLRRTISLWNDFPIPDSFQPVWDSFEWGRLPTSTTHAKH